MKKHFLILTTALLSLNVFSQIPNYVPTNGLVGWWPFNGNANDESGNGNNGTVNGATLTTDRNGIANSAFNFDGINQKIIIADNNNLSFPNATFTTSYWVNIQTPITNGSAILCKYGITNNFEYGNFIYSSSSVSFSTYNLNGTCGVNGSGLSNSTQYQNNWHYFTSVHNGYNGSGLYVDGVLISSSNSSTASCSMGNGSGNLYFGMGGGWNQQLYFKGLLDDIGIWNRVLTQCEIQDLYNAQLNSVAVNAGNDQTVCAGTSVTLSGTGADTYSWNNSVSNGVGFNPTVTNEYVVIGIDVNGCLGTDTVNVTINALPTVNAGNDLTVCAGTSVTLSGSGADTYSWNNSITDGVSVNPTVSNEYVVIGIDVNGCLGTDTVNVTINALPTVNAGNDLTVCAGTAITLSGSGANTYSWNNNVSNGVGFIPTVSNEYVVTGADVNGCLGTDTVNVTVNNTSTSTLTETALDSYTLNSQTYTQSGTYTQVIPNAAGCDSTITLNLSLSFTGLNELQTGFTIAPNPTMDFVTITSSELLYDEYVLFDPQGRKVLSGTLTGTTTQLNLSSLARGNYLLQIGEKKTPIKLIKQ